MLLNNIDFLLTITFTVFIVFGAFLAVCFSPTMQHNKDEIFHVVDIHIWIMWIFSGVFGGLGTVGLAGGTFKLGDMKSILLGVCETVFVLLISYCVPKLIKKRKAKKKPKLVLIKGNKNKN